MQPLVPGGDGLGRRQQAEGQQAPRCLHVQPDRSWSGHVQWAGLPFGARDHVTRRGMRIEFPQRPGRQDIGFGRAGLERVVRAADAEGEAAQAVAHGGRGRADGAQHLLQWTSFVSSNKACGPGPVGVPALAGPLHFRPDDPAGLTAIVPKYTMAAQAEKPAKPPFSREKPLFVAIEL